jgi:hypothetical protein
MIEKTVGDVSSWEGRGIGRCRSETLLPATELLEQRAIGGSTVERRENQALGRRLENAKLRVPNAGVEELVQVQNAHRIEMRGDSTRNLQNRGL